VLFFAKKRQSLECIFCLENGIPTYFSVLFHTFWVPFRGCAACARLFVCSKVCTCCRLRMMSPERPSSPRISPALVPSPCPPLLQPFVFHPNYYTIDTFPLTEQTRGSPTSHRPTSKHGRPLPHVADAPRDPSLIAPRFGPRRCFDGTLLYLGSLRLLSYVFLSPFVSDVWLSILHLPILL